MIQSAFEQGGLDGVCNLIIPLLSKMEIRIAELEKRLGKNSSNSSKPPSSDGLNRNRSLRKSSGRKPGGQSGHSGQTLRQVSNPDIIVPLPINQCPGCQADLSGQPLESTIKRQVFDLPPISLQVTEYQAERKKCPCCNQSSTAIFPEAVQAHTQYGAGMSTVMTYMQVGQLLPVERVAQVCEDLFNHRPSAGSVVQAVAQCAEKMQPLIDEIREQLKQETVLHADETGVHCERKTNWLHSLGTPRLTLYTYSEKRGYEGMAVGGVLPEFKGILVHDFWGACDNLNYCEHARCNVHLLRELKNCTEDGHQWSQSLSSVLMEMKEACDEVGAEGASVAVWRVEELEARYDAVIAQGLKSHPEAIKIAGRRGRVKQSKEHNLLKRLRDKREEVLRFLHDLSVPFENNLAERDLRMIKVQQKISGCFRSKSGAKRFCTIRSYLSTVRKQGLNMLDAIKRVFTLPSGLTISPE